MLEYVFYIKVMSFITHIKNDKMIQNIFSSPPCAQWHIL